MIKMVAVVLAVAAGAFGCGGARQCVAGGECRKTSGTGCESHVAPCCNSGQTPQCATGFTFVLFTADAGAGQCTSAANMGTCK